MNLANDLTKKFGDSFSQAVKLSSYSWFNLGGNAEYFFKPKNEIIPIEDVSNVINKFEKVTNIEKKETVNQKNIKPITIIF